MSLSHSAILSDPRYKYQFWQKVIDTKDFFKLYEFIRFLENYVLKIVQITTQNPLVENKRNLLGHSQQLSYEK